MRQLDIQGGRDRKTLFKPGFLVIYLPLNKKDKPGNPVANINACKEQSKTESEERGGSENRKRTKSRMQKLLKRYFLPSTRRPKKSTMTRKAPILMNGFLTSDDEDNANMIKVLPEQGDSVDGTAMPTEVTPPAKTDSIN